MLRLEGFPEPNFGCFPTDWPCLTQETVARIITNTLNGLGNFMTDMLVNAFKDSRLSDNSWGIADQQFWFWVTVMGIALTAIAVFQLLPAMILGDIRRVGQIAAGLAFSVPVSVIGVWLMRQVSSFGNSITDALMRAFQGEGLSAAIMRMFGFRIVTDKGSVNMDGALLKLTGDAQGTQLIGPLLICLVIMLIMALAAMFLYISMSLRAFSLLALAAMAPVGTMMVGQPKLAVWAVRWANLTVGLILAEPLAAGVLLLAARLLGNGTDLGPVIISIFAVFGAAFAPAWAVKLVSFAGNEVGSAIQNRPSTTNIIYKARTVMGGAMPKGIR